MEKIYDYILDVKIYLDGLNYIVHESSLGSLGV
jgi:hypothetical protein